MIHAVAALVLMATADDCTAVSALSRDIDILYRKGELAEATMQADKALACPSLATDAQIAFHLQLAAIHDRIGLHKNTRPVPESLRHINAASALAAEAGDGLPAKILLARAKYFYRAEMRERKFPEAESYGMQALAAFEADGDVYGQADAVHALGLVFFQRREMEKAREYFDRSLVLENQTASPRPVMIADYGRHVGFIYLLAGDVEASVSHFEASLAARKHGGLDDAAMFAAITLASALADVGRASDAADKVGYALDMAEKIGSASGKVRALLVAGKVHEAQGRRSDAADAYKTAEKIALDIGLQGSVRSAQAALARLGE